MKTNNLKFNVLIGLALCFSLPIQAQENKHFLPDFHSIHISGNSQIFYRQDTAHAIWLEPENSPTDMVETHIENGCLYIQMKKNSDGNKHHLIVSSKELKKIHTDGLAHFSGINVVQGNQIIVEAQGASKVTLNTQCQELIIHAEGAPILNFKGESKALTGDIVGATHLEAGECVLQNANIQISGVSRANLNVVNELNTTLDGLGSITLKNEPAKKHIIREKNSSSQEEANGAITFNPGTKQGDTTQITLGKKRITIIDDKDIFGERKDSICLLKKVSKFRGHWAGIELGINAYLNSRNALDMLPGNEYMKLMYEKSIQVNLNFFELNFPIIKQHFGLVSGLGMTFNNYRLDKDMVVDPTSDYFYAYKDVVHQNTKSKLVVEYLNIPLFMEYQTNHLNRKNSFHIGVGGQLGIRLYSYFKHTYEAGDQSFLFKMYDDFHLNDLQVDMVARIGWGKLNLYGSYSFTPLFNKAKGPQLYPFSVGLSLLSW